MWPLVPRLRPLISSCQVLVFTHYVCVYILYPRCCCSPHLSSLAASTFRMRQSSPLFFLLLLLLLLAFHTAAMASRVLREDEITGSEEIKYEPVNELEFFPRHNARRDARMGTKNASTGESCTKLIWTTSTLSIALSRSPATDLEGGGKV
ncbi:uncharacterized protein LOC122024838 isoform X1 [Zingiber officinale]|uniref:uncharacterized protein LOC122024838 isoform X1 n=1 Tax=Zingiber officinale TaxID=94328 RepID=UPI001C4BC2F2|nr:uncharacterized protein LOC122024838 isoform X1 [Zingiber officinale]